MWKQLILLKETAVAAVEQVGGIINRELGIIQAVSASLNTTQVTQLANNATHIISVMKDNMTLAEFYPEVAKDYYVWSDGYAWSDAHMAINAWMGKGRVACTKTTQ